ncbi:MAG TPA: glycosyl hydrolase family 65 protein [Streptosporangiaceae bacterium]|jgi:alpha,alpha-trehalose phosphorylase
MIERPGFPVEPWCLRESRLDLGLLAQTESLFALCNGHIGWRGNLEEGEPHGLPGSYLNGFYERRPLPYGEAGYGFPESGQTVINITNGKLIRLLVDDEPFDVRYGHLRSHERVLDFQAGVLRRELEWISPAGRGVAISSVRLVSFTQRAIAAICYDVEPLDGPTRIVVQSELVANEQLPLARRDPRVSAVLQSPLEHEEDAADGVRSLLVHSTRNSKLRLAAAMDHLVDCEAQTRQYSESWPDLARLTVAARLRPGQRLRLVKFVALGWSGTRSRPAMRDQVDGALTAAVQAGWDGLIADQRGYLDDFWRRADVELDGDLELQQAVRFGLYHVLQSGARSEGRAIAAKGLTGPGYDGHSFWDTETFVLPVLTYTVPEAVSGALTWRHATLRKAMRRARQLGLRGAAFPWRTINGKECSAYWPAGTAAFHINADIADAVIRYADVTGDQDFAAGIGIELLVQTARLWLSLGHFDDRGRFRIDGITGPDEYSALVDNNVYTNLMAQQNLQAAARAAEEFGERARELSVTGKEIRAWRAAADAMCVPYDEKLGIHQQAEDFTSHQVWDFARTSPDQYPLQAFFPYFELYRKQVIKQADLVLAMMMRPEAFTAEQKARNFDYYEKLTVRDSSLSASTQAVMAAEVGHLDLAYDYLAETALIDLTDFQDNVRDGLHMAALAGSWIAVVAGFGGMRRQEGMHTFAPRLPPALNRLAFTIGLRGLALRVEITAGAATYTVSGGGPLHIMHHGSPVTLTADEPQTLPVRPAEPRPRPTQPAGRAPIWRQPRPDSRLPQP